MRARLIVLCLLVAAQAFAQDRRDTVGSQDLAVPASQALTAEERCTVEALQLKATVLALRAELARLSARVAELEAPQVDAAVQRERASIEAKLRERIKPPETHVFDWQAMAFVPPRKEPPQ